MEQASPRVSPQADLQEALDIIRGFMESPEIADCAPDDKDPETDALERRARAVLAKTGDRS